MPTGVDDLLSEARTGLTRLSPEEANRAARAGDVLVDIRSEKQISRDGAVPGAVHVPRNVLEWRLDPGCANRDPRLARRDARIVILCDEGYQSSLVAATLKRFGLDATDVVGGFRAWRAAGMPVSSS